MTDRCRTLTVILDDRYREDDIEVLVNAIRFFRCVNDVVKNIDGMEEITARCIAARDIRTEVYEALGKIFDYRRSPVK
jgi:hypothetical protein